MVTQNQLTSIFATVTRRARTAIGTSAMLPVSRSAPPMMVRIRPRLKTRPVNRVIRPPHSSRHACGNDDGEQTAEGDVGAGEEPRDQRPSGRRAGLADTCLDGELRDFRRGVDGHGDLPGPAQVSASACTRSARVGNRRAVTATAVVGSVQIMDVRRQLLELAGGASVDRTRTARARGAPHARPGRTPGSRAPRPPTASSRAFVLTAPSGCGQRVFVKDDRVDPDRGRPRLAGLARAAVPEGLGERAAGQLARTPDRDAVPAPARHRVGAAGPRDGDRHDRRPRSSTPARAPGRTRTRRASSSGGRWGSPVSAARRWTTRRTTSSRSCSPRWARCRSRTRRVFDTAPPFPVWEPPSVAAGPRPSSRTCRTLTASSSRARTWPSAIRSGSSG